MRLATAGLFCAKWTDAIHDEWIRNVLAERPELEAYLQRTRRLMDRAVPDCRVEGYEPLIDTNSRGLCTRFRSPKSPQYGGHVFWKACIRCSNWYEGLELPDASDRHVLAAAIRAGAQAIITHNLRDFPPEALSPFGIEALHPDTFVLQQMELHEAAVVETARKHRAALVNPPKAVDAYLDTLAAQGLVASADRLWEFSESL